MRYHLRATHEVAFGAAMRAAGVIDQFGNPARGVTLDVIGTIFLPTGETVLVDETPMPVMAAIPGWHANLIAELTPEQEALLPIIPPPARPYRIFAGE